MRHFPPKPKSHLMSVTNMAKKKARRRLLGSIFLLIIALLLLLEVTSKIKPIVINPKTIEIKPKSNSSANIKTAITEHHLSSSSSTTQSLTKQQPITNQNVTETASMPIHAATSSEVKINASAESKLTSRRSGTASATVSSTTPNLATITPELVSEASNRKKLTPDEILNGATVPDEDKTPPRFFIQLLASSNKDKVTAVKHELDKKNIEASIQSLNKHGHTIYRLRIGPFTNQHTAQKQLSNVKEQLDGNQNN